MFPGFQPCNPHIFRRNESDSDKTDVKRHIREEQATGTGHAAESAARNNTKMSIGGDGGHIEVKQATVAGHASDSAVGIDTSVEHNGGTRDGDVGSTGQRAVATEAVESSGVEPSDGDGNIDGAEVPSEPDRSVDELNISLDSVATRGSSENAVRTANFIAVVEIRFCFSYGFKFAYVQSFIS